MEIFGYKIDEEKAENLFKKLAANFTIVAPVKKTGGGRFSDADLVAYDEVAALAEIEFFKKTFFSAKKVVFPVRETLFKYGDRQLEETKTRIKPSIIFLRSCDIHALQVTDLQFLKEGGREDIYYRRRREKIKIFLIECAQSFESCFCVSLKTNRTDDYSVFVRKAKNGYEMAVKDQEFKKYFSGNPSTRVKPEFIVKDRQPVKIPDEIALDLFSDPMWQEYSSRCIACGRCNTSCPTCACFTVQDIPGQGKKIRGERRRIWSSCHVKDFSLLAGKHDFRKEYGDRMRYRTLHKIGDFKKRFGRQMCVGCGRCEDVCPEYISMFKAVDKLNKIVNKGNR